MTYIASTMTSANPAADLYALIDPALSAAGYVFVDTVVIGARTHKMWRSPAGSNAQNLDWYLDVAYTTSGAGSVWFAPFEDFNPTTDLGVRGLCMNTTSTIEQTYYSRFGATGYALETNWATVSHANNRLDLSTSSFGYWISITPNRVIGLTTISTTKLVYAGLYKPSDAFTAHAGASLFPLIAGQASDTDALNGTATNEKVMVTRAPKAATMYYWPYIARFFAYSTLATVHEGGQGVIGDNSINPYLGFSTPRGRKLYVVFGSTASDHTLTFKSTSLTSPALVGELYDILVFQAVAAVARGDTVTLNSETWVLGSKLSGIEAAYAFKAV